MSYVAGRRVLVTGGSGFLGRAVCRKIAELKPAELITPRSAEFDLRDPSAIRRLMSRHQPEVVIHLAAVVGGIGANRLHPGQFFFENLVMGVHLMEEARLAKVAKFVGIGTICAYPKHTPIPFKESDLWIGYPEETNAPYGLAKKMLLVQAQAYRQEYGFNAVSLLPVNLYGPWDNFDPTSSHVIPALIRKAVEARDQSREFIEAWGTGSASREFLYVDDAANAIALATEQYDKPDPVNIGSGREITIKDLTVLICKLCGYRGEIRWDPTKPDGQPRRCLDTTRAESEFGFKSRTDFEEGLRKTIEWYEANKTQIK